VPCGFNEDGLPVGVQIVGRYQEDLAVLQFAYAFQQVTEFWKQKPKIAQ
jgi:amidase